MPIEHADKIYQAVAFAGLVFPVAFFRPPWLMMVIPILAAFGGVIGLLQPYVGRECNLQDWVADIVGLAMGATAGVAAADVRFSMSSLLSGQRCALVTRRPRTERARRLRENTARRRLDRQGIWSWNIFSKLLIEL